MTHQVADHVDAERVLADTRRLYREALELAGRLEAAAVRLEELTEQQQRRHEREA